MKLCTLKDGTRDGTLAIVSADNTQAVSARDIAPNAPGRTGPLD